MSNSLADFRHRAELARAIRNHQWEATEDGRVVVPSMSSLCIGGAFEARLNGEGIDIGPNLIPTEGLNHVLNVILGATAKISNWYVAPFKGNATPAAGWTAANFTSNSTEAVAADYTEGSRRPLTMGSAAGGVISNSASKATFTFAGSLTVYGFGILSVQAAEATTGTLFAAARLGTARAVVATDVLDVQYTLTLTST